MSTIVRSKVSPGAAPDFAVARPRLGRRLDGCWERRLTLVAAPAGYGKSVVLSQWHASAVARGPVAWLGLDERDHDPTRMGEHLISGLAGIDPALGRRAAGFLGTPGPGLGDEVIDLLLDDLAGFGEDLVVVLEDLDRIEGTAIIGDLSRLVMEAPPGVHVVVTARRDPALPTHRLRASGQLLELRAEDLAFTPTETAELVTALSGHQLTPDAAAHLGQVTEGWPVAVQLAALSLRGAADAGALARFAATDAGIVDYLSAEVLAWLRPEVRSFLLDISVLDELHPDLCDAVTGGRHGAKLLAELRQAALFVVPLGGGSGGYRLHRLVRELLRHDLATADPDRPATLRRRAAAWCLEQGDPGQAAEYLVAARAWEPLVQLVHEQAQAMWEEGRAETVLGWVQALPAPVRRAQVRLRLTEAALHLLAGRPESAAALLAALERDGDLTPGEQTVTDMLVLGLIEVANPHPEALEREERALAALPGLTPAAVVDVLQATDPSSLSCVIRFSAAKQRLLLGVPGALDDAEAASRTPASTPVVYQVHALGTLALIEALAHRPSAPAAAHRALDLVAEHLGEQNPAVAVPLTALAVAARTADDLDTAQARGADALARAVRWRRWPLVGFLLAERALVELARGAPEAALAWLDRRVELTGGPLAPLLADRFLAVERRARAALGDGDSAPPPGHDPVGWELSLVAVAEAVAAGDPTGARKVLGAWPVACSPLGDHERELATALVERAEGSGAEARARVADLLAATGRDGLVGPFVGAGPPVVDLVAEAARLRPNGHAEVVLTALRRAAGRVPQLVDPLSEREVEVLRLLPSRMSNAEIGAALFVSTNTVKTHLKHIYQKLGATDRDDAIRRARELGLL